MKRAGARGNAFLLLAALFWTFPAWAQEAGAAQYEEVEEEGPYPYRFAFSVFGGNLSGGTSFERVENLFFVTTFETDSDEIRGLRGSGRVWWRLGVEVEHARSSPGVNAVVADLAGEGRTVVPFAALDLSYVSLGGRFDVTDTWVTPFLVAGVAWFDAEIDGSRQDSSTGLLFGGGVEVPLPFLELPFLKAIFVRGDVRGLRSHIDVVELAPRRFPPDDETEDVIGDVVTQVAWTIGLGVRF